jgi:hypothetical protein
MARNAGHFVQLRVQQNGMDPTLTIQHAAVMAQMAFKFCKVSCFGDFKSFTHRVWGEVFFSKLTLALQH